MREKSFRLLECSAVGRATAGRIRGGVWRAAIIALCLVPFVLAAASCSLLDDPRFKTHVSFWYSANYIEQGINKLAQEFMRQYPQYILDLQPNKFPDDELAAFEQGSGPDVVQVTGRNQVAFLSDRGHLVDLSGLAIASKIPSAHLAAANPGAMIYAIPIDLSAIGLLYNKSIFAQHGLQPPKKYSELQALCATVKALDIAPFAPLMKENWHAGHFIAMIHAGLIGGNAGIDSWASGFNSRAYDYAQPVDTATLFSILDFYKANWPASPESYALNEQYAAFADGSCAMMVQGPWAYKSVMALNPSFAMGFVPFPVDESGSPKLFADVGAVLAAGNTGNAATVAGAKTFINWMSSAAARAIWINDCGLLPAFPDIAASGLNEPLAVIKNAFDSNSTVKWEFQSVPVAVFEDGMKNGAWGYFLGTKTADEALAYIDATRP
jgi:raffinose/stachyose/melibiose transport system substrate-binding protein